MFGHELCFSAQSAPKLPKAKDSVIEFDDARICLA
jgi:hypothetical protein